MKVKIFVKEKIKNLDKFQLGERGAFFKKLFYKKHTFFKFAVSIPSKKVRFL